MPQGHQLVNSHTSSKVNHLQQHQNVDNSGEKTWLKIESLKFDLQVLGQLAKQLMPVRSSRSEIAQILSSCCLDSVQVNWP